MTVITLLTILLTLIDIVTSTLDMIIGFPVAMVVSLIGLNVLFYVGYRDVFEHQDGN